MSCNDKVNELQALKFKIIILEYKIFSGCIVKSHLAGRTLPAFVHPPFREERVLYIPTNQTPSPMVDNAYLIRSPNSWYKDTFRTLN